MENICVKEIINYLKAEDLILATAESCTAGEIMSTIANQGDCGECLYMGYVIYSKKAKIKQLGVEEATIEQFSLTSEEVAKEMVRNVLKLEEVNLAIATTGITGNHSMDGVPAGTICFAWGFKKNNNEIYFTERHIFDGTRKKRTQKGECSFNCVTSLLI